MCRYVWQRGRRSDYPVGAFGARLRGQKSGFAEAAGLRDAITKLRRERRAEGRWP